MYMYMYVHTCSIYTHYMYMKISENHNSLGYEQPSRPRCKTITQCTCTCVYTCIPVVSLVLQSWPDDALAIVAQRFLEDVEMEDTIKDGCVEMCKEFHQTTRKLSDRYLTTLQRHNYVTPTSYLELISTYKTLLSMKRRCMRIPCTCICTYLNTYNLSKHTKYCCSLTKQKTASHLNLTLRTRNKLYTKYT